MAVKFMRNYLKKALVFLGLITALGLFSCTDLPPEITYPNPFIPFDYSITGISYGAGRFVAIGSNLGNFNLYATSIDGVNWTDPISPCAGDRNQSISFAIEV